jgi:hypothetical protein
MPNNLKSILNEEKIIDQLQNNSFHKNSAKFMNISNTNSVDQQYIFNNMYTPLRQIENAQN